MRGYTAKNSLVQAEVFKSHQKLGNLSFGPRGIAGALADKVKVAKHRRALLAETKRATITQENCRPSTLEATYVKPINHGKPCFPRKIVSKSHLRLSRFSDVRHKTGGAKRWLIEKSFHTRTPFPTEIKQLTARFRIRPEPLPRGERRGGAVRAGAQRHRRQAAWP